MRAAQDTASLTPALALHQTRLKASSEQFGHNTQCHQKPPPGSKFLPLVLQETLKATRCSQLHPLPAHLQLHRPVPREMLIPWQCR